MIRMVRENGKIMGMTGLVPRTNGVPTEEEQAISVWEDTITDLLAMGYPPGVIARKLAKGNKRAASQYRARFRRLAQKQKIASILGQKTKAEGFLHNGEVLMALKERAIQTGRPDAARLFFEVTGFHAPRVDHHHEGNVNLNITLPRPPRIVDDEDVVDAEVVED